MVNYDILIDAGIDTDGLLKRLMGNESLVKIFVNKFLQDTNFESLIEAFGNGDMKKAETASHTLKGMCGNMSLNRLFDLFTAQVSLIRSGEFEKAESMMAEISSEYEKSIRTMNEWASKE